MYLLQMMKILAVPEKVRAVALVTKLRALVLAVVVAVPDPVTQQHFVVDPVQTVRHTPKLCFRVKTVLMEKLL